MSSLPRFHAWAGRDYYVGGRCAGFWMLPAAEQEEGARVRCKLGVEVKYRPGKIDRWHTRNPFEGMSGVSRSASWTGREQMNVRVRLPRLGIAVWQ